MCMIYCKYITLTIKIQSSSSHPEHLERCYIRYSEDFKGGVNYVFSNQFEISAHLDYTKVNLTPYNMGLLKSEFGKKKKHKRIAN